MWCRPCGAVIFPINQQRGLSSDDTVAVEHFMASLDPAIVHRLDERAAGIA